jgi:glucose dehydrogenase
VIDRETGEVLSATAFVHVNTISSVDLKTGRPNYVASRLPVVNKVVREICPHSAGGKDWQPSAYSPQTRLLYIPHQNLCQDQEATQANYIAGTPYLGVTLRMYAGAGGHRGVFQAWDPVARRTVWEVHESFPVWSGALVTAGNLAFYGTMDGWFKALDARTGQVLWQHKVGSGIVAPPITYQGPDGRQHIAVVAGVGGWAGAIVAGDLDARDASAAKGFAHAMADLPSRTGKGGTVYVFSIR